MARDEASARGRTGGLALADRVELGLPQGYWEENLALGRRAALATLAEAMAPLSGRRVLDPTCGWGTTARRLHDAGARVVACAPSVHLAARARRRQGARGEGSPRFVAAAEPLGTFGPRAFDDIVLIEPAALADEAGHDRFLDQLDRLEARRVVLLLRVPTRWSALAGGGGREALPAFDFTTVLREIHLATRYRLERSVEEKRRNSALRLVVLRTTRT